MSCANIQRCMQVVLLTGLLVALPMQVFAASQPGDVDLNSVPPDLTTSVDPNIVVTFDDSGSMANDYMGDFRPWTTNGSWTGYKAYCAGVIGGGGAAWANLAMNGVYYNPNVLYLPPVNADGTFFPQAQAALTAVVKDGVTAWRPRSASGSTSTQNFTLTGSSRWKCPGDSSGSSPLPSGGPYYYKYTGPSLGTGSAPDTTALYNNSNWTAVAVTNAPVTIDGVTTTGYQNWANWYSYYRTRNMMTRTALSRVFSNFGSNLRVAWQNINVSNFLLPSATLITNIADTGSCTASSIDPQAVQTGSATTVPSCYRTALFNWIFQVPASGNTPDRLATIRAGEFFKRGNTSNLNDPYWEPGTTVGNGMELSCRQNFHMLVTDGYWNEGNPTAPPGFFGVQNPPVTLPDGTAFSRTDAKSRVFWDVPASPAGSCSSDGSTDCAPSLADIAFYYWATDLRSGSGGLTNNVPPYVPDKNTGITAAASAVGSNPLSNLEIYYNPANDPATWQHVVQFMVTLGIAGKLQYSDDVDCIIDPTNDLCKLRKGTVNSTGSVGWPQPKRNVAEAIDDTWHAAINSRGSYFSASDPGSLVSHLTDVITSILNRSSSSTALSPTMSVITAATSGFVAGYNSGDWSGTLYREPLDSTGTAAGPAQAPWEAGCKLTGGTFTAGICSPPSTPPNQSPTRKIISVADNGTTSIAFKWANLSSAQQAALNTSPTGTTDGYGSYRVEYMRGDRTQESTTPQLRRRQSLLGAIVNSRPLYVSAPTGGFTDAFPIGSPEYQAAASATPVTYAQFVYNLRARPATVYVGADDGMLHAFNAVDGSERWAYLPGMMMKNVSSATTPLPLGNINKITRLTNSSNSALVPGTDDAPIVQDVFYGGQWHSVLLGSMRLGGRGVFALDVTSPDTVTESNRNVLWEIDNKTAGFSNLGYTYASTNIARIACNQSPCSGTGGTKGGTWVALVSSGYFPLDNQTPPDPASSDAAANQTSLFVIDIQTGKLIREIKTNTAAQFSQVTASFGLSTPDLYDLNGDQVDDIAMAGDLAGNLWRFDFSDPNPSNWKVDLMFKTYSAAADVGRYPISVQPVGMWDSVANSPIFVFGTGKYLGPCDRTASAPGTGCGYDANSVTQSFFGIRDYGTGSSNYPIKVSDLQSYTPTQSVTGVRTATVNSVPLAKRGWQMTLNPQGTAPGERVVVAVTPDFTNNRAIMTTLIPTSVSDPCSPGRSGAVMVVDAGTGGVATSQAAVVTGVPNSIGKVFTATYSIPLTGGLSGVASQGGLSISLPGLPGINISKVPPNRGAWRELLNDL